MQPGRDRTVAAGVGWIVRSTWISKWAIAAAVLGWDAVRWNIGGAIDGRVGGERDDIDLAPFIAMRNHSLVHPHFVDRSPGVTPGEVDIASRENRASRSSRW